MKVNMGMVKDVGTDLTDSELAIFLSMFDCSAFEKSRKRRYTSDEPKDGPSAKDGAL